jgi:hypothetical protein
MWLLYLFAIAALLAYLKIGDFIALKGHRVWRRARRSGRRHPVVDDRLWQWLLFPYSRANNNVVGLSGEGMAADEASKSEACPNWYRILLALIWPLKLGVNALCWAGLLAYHVVLVTIRLLCGLVLTAISPRETFRRLSSAVRRKSAPTAPEAASEEPLELLEPSSEPPAVDPLYPGGRAPEWVPDPDTAERSGEATVKKGGGND